MQENFKKLILPHIIAAFDTQKKCADALGITESTLSRLLKNPSRNILLRLKGVGVHIPSEINITGDINNSNKNGMTVNGNTKAHSITENNYGVPKSFDAIIQRYEVIINEREVEIEKLKKEIERLKKRKG